MRIRSNVLEYDAADQQAAVTHFGGRLAFETDCSDVGVDIAAGVTGFVVVDCRGPELFAGGHVPGAINIPHRRITAATVAELISDESTVIVTYCNGPHCNASTRGAVRFAALGRRVKEMPGGMDGWLREGLPVEASQGLPVSLVSPERS